MNGIIPFLPLDPLQPRFGNEGAGGCKKQIPSSKLYPVDAIGELPNGETFEDVQGLKAALMKEKRTVAGSVFEGLLCYALGRDVSFTDLALIEAVLDDLEADQYPVREMVRRVVISEPFLSR